MFYFKPENFHGQKKKLANPFMVRVFANLTLFGTRPLQFSAAEFELRN